MNLTYSDVEKLISKFSYKPNFEFTIQPWSRIGGYTRGEEQFSIGITMWTLDSTKTYPPARELIGLYPRAMVGIGGLVEVMTENGRQTWNLEPSKAERREMVPLIALRSEDAFLRWLHSVIGNLEDHEIDEWFKVDGVPVNDPHKKSALR